MAGGAVSVPRIAGLWGCDARADRGRQGAALRRAASRRATRWLRAAPVDATAARGLLLAAAGWPDAREPVVIVGHQPTLGEVASFLLAGEEAYWSVKKGGVWWLTNRDRVGNASVVLRVVIGLDFV